MPVSGPVSRRTLLRTGAAATAGAALAPAIGAPVRSARPDVGVAAYAFPLSAVRLLPGSPFTENEARIHAYLTFLDIDRMLHMFRVTVGLPSSATPCGGWESPTTELRGHSTGHLRHARHVVAGLRLRHRDGHVPVPHPRSSAGTARFAITASGSGAEQRVDAPAALPTGAWTHVAVTSTGTLGVLYVDGVEVARNTALTQRPAATTNTWIGRSQYSGDPYLDGAVDGFRIYSRALTPTEITTIHGEGP